MERGREFALVSGMEIRECQSIPACGLLQVFSLQLLAGVVRIGDDANPAQPRPATSMSGWCESDLFLALVAAKGI
jgi:hypothetical protein